MSTTAPQTGDAAALPHTTEDWGRVPYREAWERQMAYVTARRGGERPDTLVFVEHPPVYTLGMRKDSGTHILWQEKQLAEQGIEVVQSNRGGDVTYHGPGQIVGYPIVHMGENGRAKDLHAYLRTLEEVLIRALDRIGVTATRREGLTGIWIDTRKVAAIGVAVKGWVTYHGFALNVNTDLSHFAGIVPCGIAASEGTVTSLQHELGTDMPTDEIRTLLQSEFWTLFG